MAERSQEACDSARPVVQRIRIEAGQESAKLRPPIQQCSQGPEAPVRMIEWTDPGERPSDSGKHGFRVPQAPPLFPKTPQIGAGRRPGSVVAGCAEKSACPEQSCLPPKLRLGAQLVEWLPLREDSHGKLIRMVTQGLRDSLIDGLIPAVDLGAAGESPGFLFQSVPGGGFDECVQLF